jgi:hypothetical protein
MVEISLDIHLRAWYPVVENELRPKVGHMQTLRKDVVDAIRVAEAVQVVSDAVLGCGAP